MSESFRETLNALNAIRFPSEAFLAIQNLALPKIWDFPYASALKSMAEAASRHQEIINDVVSRQMNFMFIEWPSMDSFYEPSVIPVRPIHERPTVTNVTVTVTIQQLVVHRDARPLVVVPESGCIELDPYLQLCMKDDEKKYGFYYYKNGEWNFEAMTALPTKMISYLHRMGLRPESFAQRLGTIAEAFDSSKISISNRIKEIGEMCDRIGVQQLLCKVGEDKWCLTRQLGCFEGTWI